MATKKVKRYDGEDESLVTSTPVRQSSVETTELPTLDDSYDSKREAARLTRLAESAPAKAKVVTKEDLAKSGLSLRDYMNKQQGLTRRGETTPAPTKAAAPAPAPTPTKATPAPTKAAAVAPAPVKAETKKSDNRVPTPEEAAANRARVVNAVKDKLSGVGDYFSSIGTMSGREAAKKQAEARFKPTSLTRPNSYYDSDDMKRGGSVKKMASGGSVSASSRGDGIASKGKTRGRMC
jgi:hypothetical protein